MATVGCLLAGTPPARGRSVVRTGTYGLVQRKKQSESLSWEDNEGLAREASAETEGDGMPWQSVGVKLKRRGSQSCERTAVRKLRTLTDRREQRWPVLVKGLQPYSCLSLCGFPVRDLKTPRFLRWLEWLAAPCEPLTAWPGFA